MHARCHASSQFASKVVSVHVSFSIGLFVTIMILILLVFLSFKEDLVRGASSPKKFFTDLRGREAPVQFVLK